MIVYRYRNLKAYTCTVSLIAIAGAIGTGLFLGLGGAIQTGGPLGALLGYATIGAIVCCVQFALVSRMRSGEEKGIKGKTPACGSLRDRKSAQS